MYGRVIYRPTENWNRNKELRRCELVFRSYLVVSPGKNVSVNTTDNLSETFCELVGSRTVQNVKDFFESK